MTQAVSNLCVSRKTFLRHWNTFWVQYRIYHHLTFRLLTVLLKLRTSICVCCLDVMYQPRSSVYSTNISHGLMINAGMLLASSRRLVFGRPGIYLWLTGKSLSASKWELMKYTWRLRASLVSETGMFLWTHSLLSIYKWLSTCKAAVFGSSSSLPRLVRLICCRIIMMASSPASLLICLSLVIRRLV